MHSKHPFNQKLLNFLGASPTPFHATNNMVNELMQAGFVRLNEQQEWNLDAAQRYVVTRNDSSIIAFTLPNGTMLASGIRMAGAHTDSPCLKLKPNTEICANGYLQLGVEVYGGALLSPWFDRDLSIAGRIAYLDKTKEIKSTLIDMREAIAFIPSLAIHLDREANKKRSINAQTDLPPMVCMQTGENQSFKDCLLEQVKIQNTGAADILDFELSLYDVNSPALVGMEKEFLASARLDNLLSCFTAMRTLLDCESDHAQLIVCNDHEEVGSASSSGAQGPFLRDVLNRICAWSGDGFSSLMSKSLMVSCDNAHGVHPNFSSKHDTNHSPVLNKGPVIKFNANQRYATNSSTAAIFRSACERAGVPVQNIVARADMACGSTIGPITAAELGVPTVDVGAPQLGMHSIRELAGTMDAHSLYKALLVLFAQKDLLLV